MQQIDVQLINSVIDEKAFCAFEMLKMMLVMLFHNRFLSTRGATDGTAFILGAVDSKPGRWDGHDGQLEGNPRAMMLRLFELGGGLAQKSAKVACCRAVAESTVV